MRKKNGWLRLGRFPLLAFALSCLPAVGLAAEYEELKEKGEAYYAEKSFSLAHEVYETLQERDLQGAKARWVEFRLADTQWRAATASRSSDPTRLEQAERQLQLLIRDIKREEERDRVWAEVQESLGDFHWQRERRRDWSTALSHYRKALDWWAGSTELEMARERYLAIVWKMASPGWRRDGGFGRYRGFKIPVEILENVLKIARQDEDKARAHYLLAQRLRRQSDDWQARRRIPNELEKAVALGKGTDWYDDALFAYAEWTREQGRIERRPHQGWRSKPDFEKALKLYRRLISEFEEGETRYHDDAKRRIREITKSELSVKASRAFLPESQIRYRLHWRNIEHVELKLYGVSLTENVNLRELPRKEVSQWLEVIDLSIRKPIREWSRDLSVEAPYTPGDEEIKLDEPLPVGAYVVEAVSGKEEARELILVSEGSLVMRTSGSKALFYFCNVIDGSPIAGAKVSLWRRERHGEDDFRTDRKTAKTNDDGLAVFELEERSNNDDRNLFAAAKFEETQAFVSGDSPYPRSRGSDWKIYAYADRPAYRPDETVRWKMIVRRQNGSVYNTPAGKTLHYSIRGPRKEKIKEGEVELNVFGAAWAKVELDSSMRLGEYRLKVSKSAGEGHLTTTSLFRLEEYKLPDFKVEVQTPEENGKKKAFLPGDTIEATVEAEYYFGGPVANAEVKVIVRKRPFHHRWRPEREYAWFYSDARRRFGRHGRRGGKEIKQETLKTGVNGKATIEFEAPSDADRDYEYEIEARVTDISRREVVGRGTVRVTQEAYSIRAKSEHRLYSPQGNVTVDFKAVDANDNPKQVEGKVRVVRQTWKEVWLSPEGDEVTGKKLEALKARYRRFPPLPEEGGERPWRLRERGYEREEVLTRTVKTSDEGRATLTFTAPQEGYYSIEWESFDYAKNRIQTKETIWVTDEAAERLGYQPGGVELIVDKDTFQAGETAPVMITASSSNRDILFCVESDRFHHYELVHLSGTSKLINLPVTEEHVPNIYLTATMVSDREVHKDTEEVIVPPVKQFLDVAVTPDEETYLPGDQGWITVTTQDHEGNPVSAEVSLATVDESVYYIQSDYAGDVRQFFYGDKRDHRVRLEGTMNEKRYVKLVKGPQGEWIDQWALLESNRRDKDPRSRRPRNEFQERYGQVARRAAFDLSESPAEMAPVSAAASASAGGFGGGRFEGGGFGGGGGIGVQGGTSPSNASGIFPGERPSGDQKALDRVNVRTDFRSTAFWQPDIETGEDGKARVQVTFPENVTSWKAKARAATKGARFGMDEATVRTRKPLIVQLQAPRFFVAGDTAVLSGVIHNNTDEGMAIRVGAEIEGLQVRDPKSVKQRIEVAAKGKKRVDWRVRAKAPGQAKLKVAAQSADHSDAMTKSYPIHDHGIEKLLAKSGKLEGEAATMPLDLPAARRPGSTRVTVQVAPSLAVTLLDALPYLIDYPYGCTEQTLSRFVPTVIVADTLKDLGISRETVASRLFGGIEKAHVGKTHPDGKASLEKLDDMIEKGLQRLYELQHADGGWGWWKKDDSDRFMTAYVLWGLTLARDAGVGIRANVLSQAAEFLNEALIEAERQYDTQAWMLHALAVYQRSIGNPEPTRFQKRAFDNLWQNRATLNAYTRAVFALTADHFQEAKKAETLVRNLRDGARRDRSPDTSIIQKGAQQDSGLVQGTAHWGEDGIHYRWSDGGVEATAFALRALLKIKPQHELIGPTVNWLIKNRRGTQWSDTRETAIAVLALSDYLQVSGELERELEYELAVNGESIVRKALSEDELLRAPSRFEIESEQWQSGRNRFQIKRHAGEGPIYVSVEARFFTEEEPVSPAGNELFVKRDYRKLVPQATLLKGHEYSKEPLEDGDSIESGQRLEVVIRTEVKNNYEYLVFEDLKPAGFESVAVQSGSSVTAKQLKQGALTDPDFDTVSESDYTGSRRSVYMELRDRKVALFVDELPQGIWELRYRLRAETPGYFHALPVTGHAMYVPEIRGNSKEQRISVEEAAR